MFRVLSTIVIIGLCFVVLYMAGKINQLKEKVQPPLTETDIRVKWVKFDSIDAVRTHCKSLVKRKEPVGKIFKACATFDLKAHTCAIYAVEPDPNKPFGEKMTLFGHELYHCFEGAYHP